MKVSPNLEKVYVFNNKGMHFQQVKKPALAPWSDKSDAEYPRFSLDWKKIASSSWWLSEELMAV